MPFPKSLKTSAEKQWWFSNKVLKPTYAAHDKYRHTEKWQQYGGKFKCPYPIMTYEEGKVLTVQNESCPVGKGAWCSNCWVWNRHRSQEGMSMEMYKADKERKLKSYLTTGLAYSQRPKPNPLMIVNPFFRRK